MITCARGSAHVRSAVCCVISRTQCAVRTCCVCVCVCVCVCTCSRGLMVKLPAVGFMQDTYWTLCISFRSSLLRSYLGAHTHTHTHTHMHTQTSMRKKKKKKSLFNSLACTHALLTRTRLCWYGCLSSYLSWRGSAASSFLSISYLKSSQHISNGLTVSKPVSLCLTQWNHVQNGLTVSERWATKSF